ncbi:MAG: hypothetical protein QOJ45_1680 [Verrucomicrobiota bacterium]|jgi:hypothetical protein
MDSEDRSYKAAMLINDDQQPELSFNNRKNSYAY